MIDFVVPWQQIAGAIAGGVVGGFSGFCANTLQQRNLLRRARRNVASALCGELEALSMYLARLVPMGPSEQVGVEAIDTGFHRHFRAERDYSPIFRSLGSSIGLLDSPLPRDLAHWYTGFAVTLERAREMHTLASASRDDQAAAMDLARLVQLQAGSIASLRQAAGDLVRSLGAL